MFATHGPISTCIQYSIQYSTVQHPRRAHQYMLDMPALAATKFPVTNEDYWHFLQVTKRM